MLQFFANIPYPWNYFSISCIPITFSSNIPYPGNFSREYPVSRKPLMGRGLCIQAKIAVTKKSGLITAEYPTTFEATPEKRCGYVSSWLVTTYPLILISTRCVYAYPLWYTLNIVYKAYGYVCLSFLKPLKKEKRIKRIKFCISTYSPLSGIQLRSGRVCCYSGTINRLY